MAKKKIRTKKEKSFGCGAQRGQGHSALADPEPQAVSETALTELAIDVWRIGFRARRESAGERILNACERAEDRLRSLGIRFDTMMDHPYDENLKVRVIEHIDGAGPRLIIECITPGVFLKDRLVREAEVVTKGE